MEIFFGALFLMANPRLCWFIIKHVGKGHTLREKRFEAMDGRNVALIVCKCDDAPHLIKLHDKHIVRFGVMLMYIPYFERKIDKMYPDTK